MLCQVRWLAVKLSSVSQPSRRGAALGHRGCRPLRCPAPLPAGWLMGRGPRGEEGGEGTPSSLLAHSSGWHRSSSGSTPQQLPQFLVYPPAPPPRTSASRHKPLLRGWGPGSTRAALPSFWGLTSSRSAPCSRGTASASDSPHCCANVSAPLFACLVLPYC